MAELAGSIALLTNIFTALQKMGMLDLAFGLTATGCAVHVIIKWIKMFRSLQEGGNKHAYSNYRYHTHERH